jgi:hypothetical protein
LVPDSRAADFIAGFPQSEQNYDKAVEGMKSRFGKDDLIAEYYVRDLLKLAFTSINGKEKLPLAKLYDQLQSRLQALDSIGRSSSKHSEFLYPLVESCLQEEVLRAWQRSQLFSANGSSTSALDRLVTFLKVEVENEERINMARSGLTMDLKKKTIKKCEPEDPCLATVASFLNKCAFDGKPHPTAKCSGVPELSIDERREKVKAARLCFICLEPNHRASDCQEKICCSRCSKRHHLLMCPEEPEEKVEPEVQVLNCKNLSVAVHRDNGRFSWWEQGKLKMPTGIGVG